MALSMDEQRVLAEIERRLVAEEPALAACLTSFRRPGPALMLKSPRARILGSLFTVALVAVISLMVYAMIPFRGHVPRTPGGRAPVQASLTASGVSSSLTAGPRSSPVVSTARKSAARNTRAAVATPRTAPRSAKASGTAKPLMSGNR